MARTSKLQISESHSKYVIHDQDEFPPLPSQAPSLKHLGEVHTSDDDGLHSPPVTGPRLDALPTELLFQIIGYLPGIDLKDFQLPTILSLSRTNRHLHNIVMDSLYSNYNSFFCKPYLFLRTMMSNAAAARKVRHLNLSYGKHVHADREKYYPTVDDKRRIKAGFKSLGLSDWKTWASECNEHDVDQETLYAAILMHTSKVASLVIDDGRIEYPTPKWIEVLNHAMSNTLPDGMHKFSHLQSIEIDLGILRLRQLPVLFRVPSLKRVRLVGLVENELNLGDKKSYKWPIPAGSSRIKELELVDCWLDDQILVTLLNSCRSLERFQYIHRDERCYYRRGQLWWETDGYDDTLLFDSVIDYAALTKALHRHRDSLKNIDLQSEDHTRRNCLGDLKSFKQLQSIKVAFSGLVDISIDVLKDAGRIQPASLIDNLPLSICSLDLRMNWVEKNKRLASVRILEYLAIHCPTALPELQRVSIICDIPPYKMSFKGLTTAFMSSNVLLEIDFQDLDRFQDSSPDEEEDESMSESSGSDVGLSDSD